MILRPKRDLNPFSRFCTTQPIARQIFGFPQYLLLKFTIAANPHATSLICLSFIIWRWGLASRQYVYRVALLHWWVTVTYTANWFVLSNYLVNNKLVSLILSVDIFFCSSNQLTKIKQLLIALIIITITTVYFLLQHNCWIAHRKFVS